MGNILRDKRGFSYTIIIFFVVAVMIISVTTWSQVNMQKQDFTSVEIRAKAINTFVGDVERDMERSAYISGYQALFSLDKYIIENGVYVTNSRGKIAELITTGNCAEINLSLDESTTLSSWENKIEESGAKIGLDTKINITDLVVNQEDPWGIKLMFNVSLSVTDNRSSINFLTNIPIESYVPIANLEDPTYMLNTNGVVTNTIVMSPYSGNFTEVLVNCTGLTNLLKHINRDYQNTTLGGSYYINSSLAPSFLDRLEGNFSPSSCCGIESLINRENLATANPDAVRDGNSVVDYLYWSNQTYSKCHAACVGSWFWLDTNHTSIYGFNTTTCV